jgi:hypothetical protein
LPFTENVGNFIRCSYGKNLPESGFAITKLISLVQLIKYLRNVRLMLGVFP